MSITGVTSVSVGMRMLATYLESRYGGGDGVLVSGHYGDSHWDTAVELHLISIMGWPVVHQHHGLSWVDVRLRLKPPTNTTRSTQLCIPLESLNPEHPNF